MKSANSLPKYLLIDQYQIKVEHYYKTQVISSPVNLLRSGQDARTPRIL
ncbi:hypothetical protein PMG71_13875 [Roseofilum sp. BLCC_M154]|uniref:Uncharacterized protein n=1 Tax=Roseofilum acuticapitatum BLCC-M154 TaxID=3022444 RepID=A0ABT7AUD1_9CYAN|nr:hypothetical protein [Roseofilum acuticapitatum]MDJ1170518.1 hypothetical protein [Roseofilum acuticapitatum BLCC-M154]